jgi:hypothetical protein|tara:strand:- start:781 stop:987 length:207 start_codon:yes stop_codon:yes gene_type:complete
MEVQEEDNLYKMLRQNLWQLAYQYKEWGKGRKQTEDSIRNESLAIDNILSLALSRPASEEEIEACKWR